MFVYYQANRSKNYLQQTAKMLSKANQDSAVTNQRIKLKFETVP